MKIINQEYKRCPYCCKNHYVFTVLLPEENDVECEYCDILSEFWQTEEQLEREWNNRKGE